MPGRPSRATTLTRRRAVVGALLALSTIVLASVALVGCAPSTSTQPVLRVEHAAAGDIVVDGEGYAVYTYSHDTRGTTGTACDASCLRDWPPVTTHSDAPRVRGVSAKVGEIVAPDGSWQLTVGGWPLYRFSGDTAPGMTNGQGSGGVWWLVAPDGHRVTSLRRGTVPGAS